jgi:micrococcal nuclease
VTKRDINRWISFATALIVLGIAASQHFGWLNGVQQQVAKAQPGLYAIDHFVDGDTIAVKMDGKTETIRMIGVDTPETHKPNTPVQCYGPAAAAYTKNLIGTASVRLESDEKSTNRDRYNRLLRYVYLPDGRLLEAELIKNGYAFAYVDFPFTKSNDFVSYQTAARTANKGLWANCQPYQLGSGRWQTNNQ